MHQCILALRCCSTSLRWCKYRSKTGEFEGHSALFPELTYLVWCLTGNIGQARERSMFCHCLVPPHDSVWWREALSWACWPYDEPQRCVCTNTHTHRTSLSFLELFLFTMSLSCSDFERSNPIISLCRLSENKAFWTGIWAAAASKE